jgi:hypothetical protein
VRPTLKLGASVSLHSNSLAGKGTFNPAAAILPVTAFTIFLSAFLLFSVQPFFAKMVLPRLGGTPAVWSVAMVFFQTVLLAGYGYAHVLSKYFRLQTAVLIHLCVLGVALFALPMALPDGWRRPPADGEALWLIGLFTVSVGLPFFAVSANGPLLQAWFARSGHAHAKDPYFLYGASNIGSFASLILYIILIEPLFDLGQQSVLWTGGFVLLAMSIASCGYLARRLSISSGYEISTGEAVSADDDAKPVEWIDRITWVALAFVPSALLVAVTAHISTDIAAAPFLWIVPLALFLLTFVIVFAKNPVLKPALVEKVLPFLLVATIYFTSNTRMLPMPVNLLLHVSTFFFVAMHFHGMMAARRPASKHLTEFYFAMSIGGVLGGIFSSLAAMHLFSWTAEYPLLLLVALATLKRFNGGSLRRMIAFTTVAATALVGVFALAHLATGGMLYGNGASLGLINLLLIAAAFYGLVRIPAVVPALCIAVFANTFIKMNYYHSAFTDRSFFGVVRVLDLKEQGVRNFLHGTTLHGAMRLQDVNSDKQPLPLTYYTADGGLNGTIIAARENAGGLLPMTGIIGVGAGSLSCQMLPGEGQELVEIDPLVMKVAQDPKYFRFLSDCAKDATVHIGDGRLVLEDSPANHFDHLIVDAYSSDSVPVHMMTTEAIGMFMTKVKAGGMLVMHLSNRHLDLQGVVAANAEKLGLKVVTGTFVPKNDAETVNMATNSIVAVLARNEKDFGALLKDSRWQSPSSEGMTPWTDGYSNILQAMWRNYFKD